DHAQEAEEVDQRPVAGERREEQIGGREHTAGAEVPSPRVLSPVAAGLAKVHAARSARVDGWRSKPFASLPSTSTSRSISACVFTGRPASVVASDAIGEGPE